LAKGVVAFPSFFLAKLVVVNVAYWIGVALFEQIFRSSLCI